jgi:hypothetical protein
LGLFLLVPLVLFHLCYELVGQVQFDQLMVLVVLVVRKLFFRPGLVVFLTIVVLVLCFHHV